MFRWVLVVPLMACMSPAASTGELTADLAADLRDGNLRVALQFDDPDPVEGGPYELAPGETLQATFRNHSVPLAAGSAAGLYTATLTPDLPVVADEPIVVTFDPNGGDSVKLTTSTTAEFALQAPASAPQPVALTWSPTAADHMRWDSMSSSVPTSDGAIETDTGQLTFPANVLTFSPPESVTIDVARYRSSTPHTAFGKTTITFNRWHTVTVEVTP